MDGPNSPENTVADINTNPGNADATLVGSIESSATPIIPPPENPIGPSANSTHSPAPPGTPVLVNSSANLVRSLASGNAPAPASGRTPAPASGSMPVPENPVGPSDDFVRSLSPTNQGLVSHQGDPTNPAAEDNAMGPSSPLSEIQPEGISFDVQKEDAPTDSSIFTPKEQASGEGLGEEAPGDAPESEPVGSGGPMGSQENDEEDEDAQGDVNEHMNMDEEVLTDNSSDDEEDDNADDIVQPALPLSYIGMSIFINLR